MRLLMGCYVKFFDCQGHIQPLAKIAHETLVTH